MHRSLQRRLPNDFGGGHDALRKRVAQIEDPLDDEGWNSGLNMLYPDGGPVTVTITRIIDPTPEIGVSTNVPSYDSNSEAPHPSLSTLVSTDTPSTTPSSTIRDPSNMGTPPSRNSPGADLNTKTQHGGLSEAEDTVPVSANSQSKGVPTGVVIGVVILAIFLALGVIIFVVRRRYVRRRLRLRKGWTGSKPTRLSSPQSQHEPKPSFSSPQQSAMRLSANRGQHMGGGYQGHRSDVSPFLPAPQSSYGNEMPYASKPIPSSSSSSPVYGPPTTTILSQPIATVVSTFITTLPDEIAITIGEAVRVLAEYDDGWALCLNSRGEKGMIPMECLDGRYSSAASNDSSDMSRGVGGNRRRVSSLQPIVGNVGRF